MVPPPFLGFGFLCEKHATNLNLPPGRLTVPSPRRQGKAEEKSDSVTSVISVTQFFLSYLPLPSGRMNIIPLICQRAKLCKPRMHAPSMRGCKPREKVSVVAWSKSDKNILRIGKIQAAKSLIFLLRMSNVAERQAKSKTIG